MSNAKKGFKHVGFKADDEVTAALELLQREFASELPPGTTLTGRMKSQVIRKAILEAAARVVKR